MHMYICGYLVYVYIHILRDAEINLLLEARLTFSRRGGNQLQFDRTKLFTFLRTEIICITICSPQLTLIFKTE